MSKCNLRSLVAFGLLALVSATGCFEQVDKNWFPQMKRQPAVQAFESVGMMPPEGSVPVGKGEPVLTLALGETLQNPKPIQGDLADPSVIAKIGASIDNGRVQYNRFCATCHGVRGDGQGNVAGPNGPFAGVMPLVGTVRGLNDGHLYTTITLGSFGGNGRMPNYSRIPSEDRWDIVNYMRYLDSRGGQP